MGPILSGYGAMDIWNSNEMISVYFALIDRVYFM